MRRAIRAFVLATIATTLFAAAAGAVERSVERINGIGLVDYSHKPTFKVGDWARYHMSGSSQMGMKDDYTVTVLIAGEEEWWGDPGFWVETWTDVPGRPVETSVTLMSYSIFNDSLAVQHMQLYQRKSISGVNDDGSVHQEIPRAAAGTLKSRTLFKRPIMWDVDTVGVDTVITPKGTFKSRKVIMKQGTGVTSSQGDSSMYNEVRENRTTFYTDEIPITHIAREDVENIIARRTWMIGRSADAAALRVRERGLGVARLVDYGNGLKSRLVPEDMQITLAESRRRNALALVNEIPGQHAPSAAPAHKKVTKRK